MELLKQLHREKILQLHFTEKENIAITFREKESITLSFHRESKENTAISRWCSSCVV